MYYLQLGLCGYKSYHNLSTELNDIKVVITNKYIIIFVICRNQMLIKISNIKLIKGNKSKKNSNG